jgi:TolB protein
MLIYATQLGGRGVLAAVTADNRVHQRITSDQSGDVREPTWGPYIK